MSKEITFGFNTEKESERCNFIYYYNDDGVWRAVLNGYKSLLRAGFAHLLELGLNRQDANDAKMLYIFMEELEDHLKQDKIK